MTIRLKLALWYGFAIAATVSVVGAIVWLRFASDLRSTLREALAVQVADAAAAIDAGDRRTLLREDPARPGIFTVVFDPSGRIVLASRNAPAGLRSVPRGASTWRPPGASVDVALFAGTAHDGSAIVAGSSLAGIESEVGRLAGLLVTAGTVATAASLVGGSWLAGRALSPITVLVNEADRIHATPASTAQRLHVRNSADEVGRLAGTLNRMLDRIERTLLRQRSFVSAASHDLRTPIAALRTELELAQRPGASVDELRDAIEAAMGDVGRLGSLAEDLLGLAAAGDDGKAVSLEAVELRDLARGVVARVTAAVGADVEVDLEVEDRAIVTDRVRVEQALGNLISNAVRHSPAGAPVTVHARRVGGEPGAAAERPVLEVDVLDRGPGVAPTDIGMLFVPFAPSRSPGGGTGLGLATADAAVRALGGRIGYRDRPGGGAWFWFRVPAPDAA